MLQQCRCVRNCAGLAGPVLSTMQHCAACHCTKLRLQLDMHAPNPHASSECAPPGHLYKTISPVALQADLPVPKRRRVYYFELTVQDTGHKGMVTMGFTHAGSQSNKQPGWADVPHAVPPYALVLLSALDDATAVQLHVQQQHSSQHDVSCQAYHWCIGTEVWHHLCSWEPNTYAYHGDDGKVGMSLHKSATQAVLRHRRRGMYHDTGHTHFSLAWH